jgi:hypothetical protein
MEDSMTTAWLDLPDPPPGRMWCVACAMFAKAEVNTAMADTVNKLAANGKNEHVRLKPVIPHLEPASVRGLCGPLQQFGIMDLCWTHLAGFELQVVSPLDPRFNGAGNMAPVPPGLLPGKR